MAATPRAPGLFDEAVAQIFALEGGFVSHPADPGGATNFGITQQTLARARQCSVTVDDVRRLTRAEAATIYRRFYWDAVRGDELSPGLGLAMFDLAVNSGPARAIRMLQGILGCPADGRVGPQTLEMVRKTDVAQAIHRLTQVRLAFLAVLPTWPVFGRGWRKRVLAVEREALRLASLSSPSLFKNG
ncbi:glycoside hydrolase family 108 protein [Microvirga puerhi]|uniref:TtsA-like Glycoside hydrolase family 108 domain-containing protein n=1 Tax=Microvirga puerhi TaxID=2876078 RepID=A0ABS7VN43_9HYPH|nr:glycosyl hydrolase 108 family protein [Microvirga puerhi]MBZ6076422.1 hypothetical protein [Microvirga puerhi]